MDTSSGSTDRRKKLGLCLAGGGFRASLFHLGVLRRLAELDVLRHVEVISTVSGGSIIGALYVLLLRREMNRKATLDDTEYIAIVDEMHRTLIGAVQRNLRTRLFANPFGVLRVLLTHQSLGQRMARIYERYLYKGVVDQLVPQPPLWKRLLGLGAGQIGLVNVKFDPGGGGVAGGLENYNVAASRRDGSCIPNLILNATSLNSGLPFRFSVIEIGDPKLGFFRYDEIKGQLLPRKMLLQKWSFEKLCKHARDGKETRIEDIRASSYTLQVAAWWRGEREKRNVERPELRLFRLEGFPGNIVRADFGLLRQAKLAAWYLLRGPEKNVTGGVPPEVHRARFWQALRLADEELTARLEPEAKEGTALEKELMEFLIEFYYMRSSEVMSWRISRDWQRLTLGDAVGASACFPPVFPPFVLLGFYDDLSVTRLGLTDGGAYDNLGITALLEENCTYIIASDTSGLFEPKIRASTGRLGMMARISSILMADVAELQRSMLREQRRVTRDIGGASGPNVPRLQSLFNLQGLAFFHINSLPPPGGLSTDADRNLIARLRTDLDAFGDVEIAALVNQGYRTADEYVRRFLRDHPYNNGSPAWQSAGQLPIPVRVDAARAQRILRVGGSRFFRALRLGDAFAWFVSLAVIGLAAYFTRNIRFSAQGLARGLADKAMDYLDTLPLGLNIGWSKLELPLPGLVALAAAMVAVGLLSRQVRRWPRGHRTVLFSLKWARALWANVLWVFNLTPAWIALGAALIAWFALLVYSWRFLAQTKNE